MSNKKIISLRKPKILWAEARNRKKQMRGLSTHDRSRAWCCHAGGEVNKKPSRWDREGSGMVRRLRCADDVCRLEAFGAFQQVKLHGLTLVQGAVAVLLDRGEVHEHVFSR